MRIEFRKITPSDAPFRLETEHYRCEGTFRKLSQKLVEVSFHLDAKSTLVCDRCGESYEAHIDQSQSLRIADGCFEGEDLDVIEVFDHYIDFDAIVSGEIESIRSDYHFCDTCKENEGE